MSRVRYGDQSSVRKHGRPFAACAIRDVAGPGPVYGKHRNRNFRNFGLTHALFEEFIDLSRFGRVVNGRRTVRRQFRRILSSVFQRHRADLDVLAPGASLFEVRLFQFRDLVDSTAVASAFELRFKKCFYDLRRLRVGQESSGKREDVCVVVLPSERGDLR